MSRRRHPFASRAQRVARWLACAALALASGACRCGSAEVPLELASARGVVFDPRAASPPIEYDPIALAAASIGHASTADANIPAQCYTRTDGHSNPCATCHTHSTYPNLADDWELQQNYPYLDTARVNPWRNLFRDRTDLVVRITDADLLAYIRRDNYGPLRAWIATHPEAAGWHPDLDLAQGFDDDGFARDGTGWRAFRYKPFPGAFWPTNGSADDVFVRLPDDFRRTRDGSPSREVYRANLAILEAAIAGDPRGADVAGAIRTIRTIEPIDETAIGLDLDRDGRFAVTSKIVGLPSAYAGAAAGVAVHHGLYPRGTELLHTVRYLDPDRPGFLAQRMKEVRYMRKTDFLQDAQLAAAYTRSEAPDAPLDGDPLTGVRTAFTWQLQGWIEDARGWLRLQTTDEHRFCVGCHTNLGITVDQTFALARKVPGRDGWRVQDPRGIPDAPQIGHALPEYAEYVARVGGGDDLRSNTEVLERDVREGVLDPARAFAIQRDIGELLLPSRDRALALDRAYLANVIEQSYIWGRDAITTPARNVHATIGERSTGLGEADRVYRDGRLSLAWTTGEPITRR